MRRSIERCSSRASFGATPVYHYCRFFLFISFLFLLPRALSSVWARFSQRSLQYCSSRTRTPSPAPARLLERKQFLRDLAAGAIGVRFAALLWRRASERATRNPNELKSSTCSQKHAPLMAVTVCSQNSPRFPRLQGPLSLPLLASFASASSSIFSFFFTGHEEVRFATHGNLFDGFEPSDFRDENSRNSDVNAQSVAGIPHCIQRDASL